MAYKYNPEKEERIYRFGQTVDLPLFEQDNVPADVLKNTSRLPDWIWDGSRIKSEVYQAVSEYIPESRMKVLRTFIMLGGSATDNEVCASSGIPVHLVAARRNELLKSGIIRSFPDKFKITPGGNKNNIWFVNFSRLRELIDN